MNPVLSPSGFRMLQRALSLKPQAPSPHAVVCGAATALRCRWLVLH